MAQSSPLLDQYNQDGIVTPALQRAMEIARQKLPQIQLPGSSAPDSATPRLAPPGAPVPSISRGQPPAAPGLVSPNGQAPSAGAPAPAAPGTPMITQPMAAPVSAPTPRITNPEDAAHLTELNRLTDTGSGISQVKNPIGRGLLRGLDVAGSAFFPNITAGIPGTEEHHNYLVKRAEGTVNQDVSRAKENAGTAETEARTAAMPGENALKEAQTAETNAHAASLKDADKGEAKTIETDQGIMQWNPDTKRYDIPAGQAPGKQSENTHVLPDGTVIAVHSDPKTGKSAADVLYQGKPAEKPGHVIQRMVNGKMHNILVDAETGQDRQDLGEGRQPTPADHGTTVIGPDGKILRLEPGQTAPTGFTTPQQTAAGNAAEGKGLKSANDAVKYGQDYVKSGQFTGPKDEALLEAFFEVAKPSSGFRMSQPQIDMLMKGRSWIDSAEGIAYHAKTGVWFPPDQRKQIVDAMEARAASKGAGQKNGPTTAPTIKTQAEYDALPKGAEYMEDGKKYRKP